MHAGLYDIPDLLSRCPLALVTDSEVDTWATTHSGAGLKRGNVDSMGVGVRVVRAYHIGGRVAVVAVLKASPCRSRDRFWNWRRTSSWPM
jgi:hypothetical protein